VEDRCGPARWLAERFAELPEVEAVALGGSGAAGRADADSDVDLYVYATSEPASAARSAIASERGERVEVGNTAFELGDEWVDAPTGRRVDVTFRTPAWIEAKLDRLLVEHRASVGYSTCFWWNVRTAVPLFDRSGWLARLEERAATPYPEPLRRAIVATNHPLLRGALSSFLHQVELALDRGDAVSVQHRTAALLASYVDVLFALNRALHPGEKRLLAWAEALCPRRPPGMADDVEAVLRATAANPPGPVPAIHRLIDRLDALLVEEGLVAATRGRTAPRPGR
jgi:predicted nucleotidyltransferase